MSADFSSVDISRMRRALALAEAQLGRTAPNPAVGCIIANKDRIVAEAATGTGRPLLAEDAVSTRYDADFAPLPGESLEAALDRLGAAGLTRVRVAPNSNLAAQARAAGLLR